MDNMNVTIHTNQRATAELMDHGPEQPQEYRDEMMLSRFVYKCIEQWPRSVHLSLGVKPTDVNHMKAAKIRAAAIHSTLTSVGSSYDSTSAPKSLPSQVPSSTPPVPSSTVPPPVTNSTTQQSVPSDWLSGIPYPIPFEMAGAQHYPSSQQQPIYSVHDQQRLQTPASSESTITFMKPIEVNGNTTTQSDAPVPLSPTSGHGVTITHPPRLGPVEQQQQQQPGAQQHQEPRQITPPSLSLQQTPPQTPGPPQAK
ncbi:hypothetical protein BC941DRAFT_448724 [Chlamydoabsidia padenii]|nr:hypothetical protein BC941DRAFT_448724 [Chlamydoabsidia padenii]